MANITRLFKRTSNDKNIKIPEFGERTTDFMIYCINCTKNSKTTLIYNTSKAIQISGLTNMPQSDEEYFFFNNHCQYVYNIGKSEDMSFGALHIFLLYLY